MEYAPEASFASGMSWKGRCMAAGITRREFLKESGVLGAGLVTGGPLAWALWSAQAGGAKMNFGLCTYLWGQHWDLPTVIANCEKTGTAGVELRTEHAHR